MGEFRFPDAEEVATLIGEREIDVLIVGPLTAVGMEELGTLQQVRDFMKSVDEFRKRSGRRLSVVLIHQRTRAEVSGAWEGVGDTLLHAEVHAPGQTTLTIQKARWSSKWHKRQLKLGWTEGEGFQVGEEPERDLVEEAKPGCSPIPSAPRRRSQARPALPRMKSRSRRAERE